LLYIDNLNVVLRSNFNEHRLKIKNGSVYLYFKIGSVCPSVCAMVSASINPLYPPTDCAAATNVSGVSVRWQLSR